MTIGSEICRKDYVGNGVLDTYGFTWDIYLKSDIDVYVSGVKKTVDIHYTIELGINNVVFGEDYIPADGAPILIISTLPLTQLTDYLEAGKFPAETHEIGLDRVVRIAQQHEEKLGRALSLGVTKTLSGVEVAEPGAGKYLRWNLAGDGIDAVDAVYDLGNFLQSGTGAVSRTAMSKMGEIISITDFGAISNNGLNNSPKIQAAIDYASSIKAAIYAPQGKWEIGTALTIPDQTVIYGAGPGTVFHGSGANNIFEITGDKCIFENFAVQTVAGGGSCFELTKAHRNTFINIYAYRAAGKVFHLKGSLLNSFINPVITTNAPQSPYPDGLATGIDTGFYLENSNSTTSNSNSIFHPIIEGTTTHGIYITGTNGHNLILGGTIETGAIGVCIDGSKFNVIDNVWFESFTTADIVIDTGQQNQLRNVEAQGTVSIETTSHRNIISGGNISTLTINTGCSYNSVSEVGITNFQDFGSNTFYRNSYWGSAVTNVFGDKNTIHYGSAPVAGTWRRGVVVWEEDPAIGDSPGWICTANGTFSAATDNTGDTDGSTAVITGMTDTSDFNVGEWVTVSAGFPSATTPYQIRAKTATTMTLSTSSDAAQSNVTVATVDPVFTELGQTKLSGSVVWNPGNLADGAGETSAAITVTGAALGDFVLVSAPYDLQDCIVTGYVQAANTVEIRLQNESTGAIDFASGTWRVQVLKP